MGTQFIWIGVPIFGYLLWRYIVAQERRKGMKKKLMWSALILIVLIIVAVPVAFFYVLSNGNPYTNYIADKKIPKYLEEKGYTVNDIEESHYVSRNIQLIKIFITVITWLSSRMNQTLHITTV